MVRQQHIMSLARPAWTLSREVEREPGAAPRAECPVASSDGEATPTRCLRERHELVTRGGMPSSRRPMVVALAVASTLAATGHAAPRSPVHCEVPPPASGDDGAGEGVLVLFDTTGPEPWSGELYATAAANLASHFGVWSAAPVIRYREGDIRRYRAVIYVGSTYDEPLPAAFLADVIAGTRPVLWVNHNIWQLARAPGFDARFGFRPASFDYAKIDTVTYKGTNLDRHADNAGGLMNYAAIDAGRATVLATAKRPDGTTVPWAVRSAALTYVGENPFAYISERDRYLAFSDLLFDLAAPDTKERHRALVRIEDVHAETPPQQLRAIADMLAREGVPYSVAVVPVFVDPHAAPERRRVPLHRAPAVVAALKEMVARGATLVAHGDTHQYGREKNPYSGASVADFEFYRAHVDDGGRVALDGPVAEDSRQWATARGEEALAEFAACGLPRPTVFEYPHYAGSAIDSLALRALFPVAYQRGLYFTGILRGTTPDSRHSLGLFYPYIVKDVYGWTVLPEDLGNFVPSSFNGNAARSARDIVDSARVQRVVRDGVASFFFHPMYPTSVLLDIVRGIRSLGYTFAPPSALLETSR
jgi:uncharacterized protein YdaL